MAVNASEEFLGQRDDDARGASQVAEPVHFLVLGHLADEFGSVDAQAGHGVVDVFDREYDLPEAQRVRRGNRWLGPDQLRVAELRQLDQPVALATALTGWLRDRVSPGGPGRRGAR